MVSNSSSGNNSDQQASEHYQETDSYVADETYSHEMITDQPSINWGKYHKLGQSQSNSVMMESFGFTDLVMATNPTVKVKTDIQRRK